MVRTKRKLAVSDGAPEAKRKKSDNTDMNVGLDFEELIQV
jgi:hypothetical protein